jgi:hypothetical protein
MLHRPVEVTKIRWSLIIAISVLTSCAAGPTAYQEQNADYGAVQTPAQRIQIAEEKLWLPAING